MINRILYMKHFILKVLAGLLLLPAAAFASPWLGGYITMQQTTTGSAPAYEFSLYLFIDPYNLSATLENDLKTNPQKVLICQKSGHITKEYLDLSFQSESDVSFVNDICAQNRSLGIRVYKFSVQKTLVRINYGNPGGYYLAWERCCRNALLSNIQSPGQAGLVLYSEFPPLLKNGAVFDNSLPTLNPFAGDYVCRNAAKAMSVSCSDAENDVLSYKMASPMKGHNTVANFAAPATPGPYAEVDWAGAYHINAQTPNPSPISVGNAGVFSLTSGTNGLFTFNIQVGESRNGESLGFIQINLQLPVSNCSFPTLPAATIQFADGAASPRLFCGQETEMIASLTSGYQFQWKQDNVALVSERSPTLKTKLPGKYTLSVIDATTCQNEGVSNVLELQTGTDPNPMVSAGDMICEAVPLKLSNQKGEKVKWYKERVFVTESTELMVTQPGDYGFKTAGNSCPNMTDSLQVAAYSFGFTNYLNSPFQLNLCVTDPVMLEVPFDGNYIYEWSQNNIVMSNEIDPFLTTSLEGTYTLKVTHGGNGCVNILPPAQVLRLNNCESGPYNYFPNAFTPNGDARNDVLEFPYTNLPSSTIVKVYDRWGNLVYSDAIGVFRWDGTYNKEPAKAGSYILHFSGPVEFQAREILLLR